MSDYARSTTTPRYVGLGAPGGPAARAALTEAIRAAKA